MIFTVLINLSFKNIRLFIIFIGVIILMTLELSNLVENDYDQQEIMIKSQSDLFSYVENYLFKIWSNQVGEDQLRPLFTRIANNVIFV